MKQRIYTLLFALLTIVTGAKAQTTNTIELYDGLAYSASLETAIGLLEENGYLNNQPGLNGVVQYYRQGKLLFTVEEEKSRKVIHVPTTVIPSEADFPAFISERRVSVNFSILISQKYFPDATFRTYVKDFDTETRLTPNRLTKSEFEKIKKIDVKQKEITSLKGVEYFAKLDTLDCRNNQLTALDVSKNTKLTFLSTANNPLASLDVSKNTALTTLWCYGNPLTKLDVSHNTKLIDLECNGDQLTELDVSNNKELKKLLCDDNQLTKLNVLGCTKVERLYCYNNQLTTLDVSGFTALSDLELYNNQLTTLDVSGCIDLKKLNFNSIGGNEGLTTLKASGCTSLEYLYCYDKQLTTFDVSGCSALKWLHCGKNRLTALNLTGCTSLTNLYCNENQLTTIDVSECSALQSIDCYQNQLTSLDVSGCSTLKSLYCYQNKIRGAGMATLVNSLPTVENGKLYVYKEEDVSTGNIMTPAQVKIAKDKGWNPMKSEDQDYLGEIPIDEYYFPDEIFRNWLKGQDYGKDGLITQEEIETVKKIRVDERRITSLKGIEHFTKLDSLNCSNNQLTSLDVSGFEDLKYLHCYKNKLTTLDVSNCKMLVDLSCFNNQLTELVLSNNSKLEKLECGTNNLTELNVSNNTELVMLQCDNNQLTELDVSGLEELEYILCLSNQLTELNVSNNTKLVMLQCDNNQLTELDVSGFEELMILTLSNNQLTTLDVSDCKSLEYLYCDNNQLTTLNVSGCTALNSLACFQNQIRGTGMTALVSSLPGDRSDAYMYVYDAHESAEGNVMTKTQVLTATEKGWKIKRFDRKIEGGGSYWEDYDGISVRGDANGDGELTAADVETVSDYILGQLPDEQPIDEESADLNGDSEINIEDLTLLIDLITTPIGQACPDDHHPHLIDLGLPSGTLWACCNVGADKPEAYGGYYAWGETKAKDYFDWSTYIYCEGTVETCQDIGTDIAGTKYDAAYVNWGGNWATPSYEQFQELKSNTTSEWTTQNGVNGRLFTASNGATLFLSASGGYWPGSLDSKDRFGYYWSSSFEDDDRFPHFAKVFYFGEDGVWDSAFSYMLGLPVRPVRK